MTLVPLCYVVAGHTGEIREFFNAGGLEDKLNDIKSKGLPSSEGIALIDKFLGAKHGQVRARGSRRAARQEG